MLWDIEAEYKDETSAFHSENLHLFEQGTSTSTKPSISFSSEVNVLPDMERLQGLNETTKREWNARGQK